VKLWLLFWEIFKSGKWGVTEGMGMKGVRIKVMGLDPIEEVEGNNRVILEF